MAELAKVMTVYPQVLINVSGVDRRGLGANEVVAQAVRDAESELGEHGRVLLRPSGTESLIRVMVEAADADTAARIAGDLAAVVTRQLAVS